MLIFLLFFFFNFTSILVAFLIFQLFRHLCVDLKKMILSLGRKVRPYIRACPFPCVQYSTYYRQYLQYCSVLQNNIDCIELLPV